MYFIAIIITMAIFSGVVMVPFMMRTKDQNKIVFMGMVASWAGILALFAISSYTGKSISEFINLQIKESVSLVVNDESLLKIFNLGGLSKAVATKKLTDMYQLIAIFLPSMIMILGAFVSMLTYKAVWHLGFKGRGSIGNFYLREFSISRQHLFMWILMVLVAYMGSSSGITDLGILMMNLEIFIRNMMKLEGILMILFITKVKNKSKFIGIAIILAMLIIPYGEGILIGVGLYSTIYGIRRSNVVSNLKKR